MCSERTVFRLAAALLLTLALPAALSAEVVVRTLDPEAAPPRVWSAEAPSPPFAKIDLPSTTLVVPFFEVDRTSSGGTTTLFAVRNIVATPVDIEVRYQAPDGTALGLEQETLGPFETLTRNVRDVAGLPTDPDGFARGFIVVVQTTVTTRNLLVGDYFQVDVENAFATGERMVSLDDLCSAAEVRALDFGSGTELHFLLGSPRGANPATDPASVQVSSYDEQGNEGPVRLIYTDDFTFGLFVGDLFNLSFGTLIFEFGSGGGAVYAEYSAGGLFSAGINAVCWAP